MTQCRAETSVTMKTSGLMYCVPHHAALSVSVRSDHHVEPLHVRAEHAGGIFASITTIAETKDSKHLFCRRREPWVAKASRTMGQEKEANPC